jgi:LmbE family N-acetylglucosaminyl deacetylase
VSGPAESLDVIAVGAHPDDVEIGCGGTLAMLASRGLRVGIVDLTDGEPTPGSSGPQERLAEAEAAARVLGVVHRETLDFPNRRLFDGFEVRVALAKIFRRYRPRLVLGLADKTPLASPDHAQAVAITEAGVFYSRLSKWPDTFEGLPEHTVPSLMGYFLMAGVPAAPNGQWPLAVDIADHLETKLEAIACYRTQFSRQKGPPYKPPILPRVRAIAETTGLMAGCAAAELLADSRLPRVRDASWLVPS